MLIHSDSQWPPRRCNGESCRQGRAECKTPDACQLPDDDFLTVNQLRERAANRIAALVFVVAVLCMVAFVASGAWK